MPIVDADKASAVFRASTTEELQNKEPGAGEVLIAHDNKCSLKAAEALGIPLHHGSWRLSNCLYRLLLHIGINDTKLQEMMKQSRPTKEL